MSFLQSRRTLAALTVTAAALFLIGAVMLTTSTGLGRALGTSAEPAGETAPSAIEEGALTSDSSGLETTPKAPSVAASEDGSDVTPLQPITNLQSGGEGEPEATTAFEGPSLANLGISAESVSTTTPTPGAIATPAPMMTASPSPTPVPTQATVETPTTTPTQEPTQTPVPTSTATAAPEPTATPSPTPTATPTEAPPPPPPPPPAYTPPPPPPPPPAYTPPPPPPPTVTPTPVPAQSELAISSGQGTVGSTVQLQMSLTSVQVSLSGFLVTVVVENPTVAQIVAVQFPDYSDPITGFKLTRLLGSLPAASVGIAAVDLAGALAGPFDTKVLATISVQLLAAGSTQVSIVASRVDDDAGQFVAVTLKSGALNVRSN